MWHVSRSKLSSQVHTGDTMVRGWRPYLYGEPAVGQHRDMRSDICAFDGCERSVKRTRSRHGKNKTRMHGQWCPAHSRQFIRHGIAGMKPINETLSAANKKGYQKRRKNAGK